MSDRPIEVQHSPSSWQQPVPEAGSQQRRDVIDAIVAGVLAAGPGCLRVGIDGRTAAGKTSLGHELAGALVAAGRPVLRASLDDFKKPWRDRHLDDRESGEGYYRNAFDYEAVRRLLLEPAGPTGSGQVALCSIDALTQADHSAAVSTAADDAVLVVDGVFAFRPEIDDHWDVRIWVLVDPETSLRRGTVRDGEWAGPDAEAIHRDRYGVAEEIYLAEVDPTARADFVVDNTSFDRPRLLRD